MKTKYIINRYTLGGYDNNFYRMRFDVCETRKLVNISVVRRLDHEIDPLLATPYAYCQIKNKPIHKDDAIDFETARKLWSDAIEDGWKKMETLRYDESCIRLQYIRSKPT